MAYVAKDDVQGRACHVIECGGGLAQDVITTIGQAFELRFKNYLAQRAVPLSVQTRYMRLLLTVRTYATHTHPFNGPLSGTTQVSRYQKRKTSLDFIGARDSEWQWHQLGHMQIYTSLQTNNNASTPPLSFLQAGCPSCRPTNSVKALKENHTYAIR